MHNIRSFNIMIDDERREGGLNCVTYWQEEELGFADEDWRLLMCSPTHFYFAHQNKQRIREGIDPKNAWFGETAVIRNHPSGALRITEQPERCIVFM